MFSKFANNPIGAHVSPISMAARSIVLMSIPLFTEIQSLGFTGCYTHLARFIASWQRGDRGASQQITQTPSGLLARDPATGRQISLQTVSILCI
jgi:hypothetical protein